MNKSWKQTGPQSPLRWRLMLFYLLLVLRTQRVQRCHFGLLGAPLHIQELSLKEHLRLPSVTQTVKTPIACSTYQNNHSFVFFVLVWLTFFSVRRGTDWGTQAGEGSEKAAGGDKARAAPKGERFVVSKQTPQEPRWAEEDIFLYALITSSYICQRPVKIRTAVITVPNVLQHVV